MKRTIFTGFSPNLEWDDAFLAWRLLFMPWRWRSGTAPGILEAQLAKDFDLPYVVSFESGRTALATLLETSGLANGDEVALQAYTCVAVPNAILWAGFQPLYIDCDSQTLTLSPNDLERKITPKTKAVIIQYTFGQVGRLEEIIAVARKHNLIIIEDSAHVISGTHKDRLLGTWGDASFLSFGRDKAISGVFGGVAMTRNEGWGRRLKEKQSVYEMPTRAWVLKQILHPIITFKAKLLYDIFSLGKLAFVIAKKLRLITKTVEPEERNGKKPLFVFHAMPNALARFALHQYAKRDRFNLHRQKVSDSYSTILKSYRGVELMPESEAIVPLRYLLRITSPEKLLFFARREKIYLGDWYDTVIAPRNVQYSSIRYNEGSCPQAEAAAKKSVNLPTDIHINERVLKRIFECLDRYLNSQ